MRISAISTIFLLPITLLSLSGCLFVQPNPDEVVARLAQAASGLTSFHYVADLNLEGRLPISMIVDASQASLRLTGDMMNHNPAQPQFTAQANITGVSAQGPFDFGGEVVGLADYTYFRLTNLTLPTLAPVSFGADSRWYKIRHLAELNPDEKRLGAVDKAALTPAQVDRIRQLIATTPLFEVVEVLPDATVHNQRSYHYRARFKADAVTSLNQQLGELLGADPTSQLLSLSDYQPELWINKRTFQLSQFYLNGLYLVDQVPIAFELSLGISRHNDSFKITAPSASEELDAEHWLRQQISF